MLLIPNPEEVFQNLAGILPTVYSSIDYGIFKAKEFFDQQEKDAFRSINSYLAPSLVRFYAIQILAEQGHKVVSDETNQYLIQRVQNNGMYITNDLYNIRILKSQNGDLPSPGNSYTRQLFYQQMTMDFPSNDDTRDKLNLVMLWNVDKGYNLESVTLACPRNGGKSKASVDEHWHVTIPTSLLDGSIIDLRDKQMIEEIEDLPLFLKRNLKIESEGLE